MTRLVRELTLEMAKTMADACEKKANELNIRIVIAIMDGHGNLKYFRRMDGSSSGSIQISQLKANTSASLPISTKQLAERNAGLMPNGPYGGGAIPGIVLLEGGLPIITADGFHIGGIGISGATSVLDGQVAQAGLDAIAEQLK